MLPLQTASAISIPRAKAAPTRNNAESIPNPPTDAEAFRAGLLGLIPHLRAFAQTLCRNRDMADDLAQQSIANAWQARASFVAGTNLKAWLFVIQRNAFYSNHRRKWRQVEWDDDAMERALVTPGSQEESVSLTELKRAMSTLPDEQREALILVGAGGFSYEEAAGICSCATGTMKSRVSRARKTLTALMAGQAALPKSEETGQSAYQEMSLELDALTRRDPATARMVPAKK